MADVEMIYGEPYEVRELPGGAQEYIYIQRIDCGRSASEITEYVFMVQQGKIVGKNCRQQATSTLGIFQ